MPASIRPTVEVHDLAKSYGPVAAVRGVTFTTSAGEIFGLLGRNGAGKTTTLECLVGLRRPDSGRLILGGIDALAETGRARAIVGAQLQAATLQEKITPREALRYFASFYRRAVPVEELLARFALDAKADAAFDSLSGGQKQRLFLALAFVHQPKVVVLDEPTAGLDPQARRELHVVIRQARAAGVAVVLSTHDLAEAQHLFDRIGILHEGRLIAVGTPAELIGRARGQPRIAVQTARPLRDEELHAASKGAGALALRRVAAPVSRGEPESKAASATFECPDVNQAIMAIVQNVAATGNTLLDLQIKPPTLEQVFIELTGSEWEDDAA